MNSIIGELAINISRSMKSYLITSARNYILPCISLHILFFYSVCSTLTYDTALKSSPQSEGGDEAYEAQQEENDLFMEWIN